MQNRTKFDILDEIEHHKKMLKELEVELEAKNNVVGVTGESQIQPTTKKRLKIKFWKAEKALGMQILEQEGLPEHKNKGRVWIASHPSIYANIQLRGSYKDCDLSITHKTFHTNQDRDEYLDKITNAITDELFPDNGTGGLKVGDMCEVKGKLCWRKAKLIAILPEHIRERYIVDDETDYGECIVYKKARPIVKHSVPTVETNGEVITYTWEEEE